MTVVPITTTVITDLGVMGAYGDVGLPMWTVYDHPRDFPNHVVARLFDGMTSKPTEFVFVAKSEADMRKAMTPWFVWVERDPTDDANILGTYL